MTSEELIAFEKEIAELFAAKKVRGPIHLSGGNEEQLLDIFQHIDPADWIFSTYRSHYHALLHGLPREWIKLRIAAGHSMNLMSRSHHFFTSAIVGGILPIAVGTAAALKRKGSKQKVWCFVGDMAATTGAFHEAQQYSLGHDLPIKFVIEDNGMSCNTPTWQAWGQMGNLRNEPLYCPYNRIYPHSGVDKWVQF